MRPLTLYFHFWIPRPCYLRFHQFTSNRSNPFPVQWKEKNWNKKKINSKSILFRLNFRWMVAFYIPVSLTMFYCLDSPKYLCNYFSNRKDGESELNICYCPESRKKNLKSRNKSKCLYIGKIRTVFKTYTLEKSWEHFLAFYIVIFSPKVIMDPSPFSLVSQLPEQEKNWLKVRPIEWLARWTRSISFFFLLLANIINISFTEFFCLIPVNVSKIIDNPWFLGQIIFVQFQRHYQIRLNTKFVSFSLEKKLICKFRFNCLCVESQDQNMH